MCFYIISFFTLPCRAFESVDKSYADLREAMVKYQIEDRGITNHKVLQALRKVERHLFVPPGFRKEAYNDYPLPIGEGQTISQPYIVALMTEILAPFQGKKVLEIGTGSGYQAAVLAELYDQVYTIEIMEVLGQRASHLLNHLGYRNIKVKIGDGYKGWKKHSPFDAIIVTCAPSHIPSPLKDQLAEGGKMVIPVGEQYGQKLILLTKKKGRIKKINVIPVRFVPMLRKNGGKY